MLYSYFGYYNKYTNCFAGVIESNSKEVVEEIIKKQYFTLNYLIVEPIELIKDFPYNISVVNFNSHNKLVEDNG